MRAEDKMCTYCFAKDSGSCVDTYEAGMCAKYQHFLSLPCKIGALEVFESGYTQENYPGYLVSLKDKKLNTLTEVLFEVDENESPPLCKIHIWDTTHEDPVFIFHGRDGKLEEYKGD